jgi:RimJ/RimL family protein N-acetyltransferase
MGEPSVDASEHHCRASQAAWELRTGLAMLLFLRSTGELVGSSGVHALDWTVRKCEIGYWGRTRFGGQGLITEAVQAITRFAFDTLGLRRVEALPDDANRPSWRVCERAGYTLEATRRNDRIAPDGAVRHTRVYAAVC